MSRNQKSNRSSLCDEREDLLSSVRCLKERISLTEQTLSSLSTPRAMKSSSECHLVSHDTPGAPPALSLADLRHTPRGKLITSPTRYSKSTNSFNFSQYRPGEDMVDAALANNELIESGGGDRSALALKQLRELQQSNTSLEKALRELQNKLEEARTKLAKATTEQSIANDDITTYKKLVSQLQETIVCLESQVKLQDNAIRKGEARHTGHKEVVSDSNMRLKQCSDMLRLTEERMAAQQNVIKSLRVERDGALGKVEELEKKLSHSEAADSRILRAAKDDLQKRNDENRSLAAHNKELIKELSEIKEEMTAKDEELESRTDEITQLSLSNKSLTERVKDLSNRVHSSECQVIESKTLQNQNTDLHKQLSQLQQQLLQSEQMLKSERQHKFKEIGTLQNELKAKTARMSALEEQFGLMETGLLTQKKRMSDMEREVQQVDNVKMENIELRCRLEESERKLVMCQQEISVTSQQLGKLENLATMIESRESVSMDGSHKQSADLRSELKEKSQEVSRLQNALEETESKLRLAELASSAKDKVQKKSEKLVNSTDKARLLSEVSRLKSKLTEGDTKCEMLQSRMKEMQTEMSTVRKKYENSLQTNKNLKQQKLTREAENKALRNKIGELEKNVQLKCTELEDSLGAVERLQRQVHSLKKDMLSKSTEKDEHVDNLQQQCELWQQQLTSVQRQKDGLKTRLSELQEKYTKSQEILIKIESQLETKEKGMNDLHVELETARSETDVANTELSTLAQTTEARMTQLETTLSVTREQCEALTRQLHEEKADFERHLSEKDNFIKEYQNRLKASQKSLKDVETDCSKLERELQANRQTGSENAHKVHTLEGQHVVLGAQVQQMEQTLKKVGTSHQRELAMLNEKLKQSLENVEQSKNHIQSLNDQVDDLRRDKASLLAEVESLESRLTHNTSADKSRLERLSDVEIKLKETQDALVAKEEDVIELEARLQKMELDLEHNLLLNTQFEGEFRRAQNDLKSAMGQCEELQSVLSSTREDKKSMESRLRETERSLRRAQEELNIKIAEVDELEAQVTNQERQLLTRAQQVSKLDVTINSYRNDMETQLQQNVQQLEKCKKECQTKTENVRRIEDQCTQLHSVLDVRAKELSAAESLTRKLQADLLNKSKQVSDLETRLDGLEEKSDGLLHCVTSRTEEITTKDELIMRYEDQVDRLKFEVTESRVERETLQEKHNRTKDQLQQYLNTVYQLEQRLIGCEESQAGKSVGLEDARKELELLQTQHKKEISRLEEAQSDFMASKENLEWSYQSKLQDMESKERQLSKQLQLANDQIQHLKDELYRRLELVKNANEAVVIKEAEIARLEAKVSGIERRWVVTNTSPYRNGYNNANLASEHTDTKCTGNNSMDSTLPSFLRDSPHANLSPIVVRDEELLARREKASRILFPSVPSASNENICSTADELTTHSTVPGDLEQTEDKDDTIVSHDDTLAREREELFTRLDELNNELVEPASTVAAPQSTACLIPSASDTAVNGHGKPMESEEYESTSESLCTIKQGPENSNVSNGDGTAV